MTPDLIIGLSSLLLRSFLEIRKSLSQSTAWTPEQENAFWAAVEDSLKKPHWQQQPIKPE